MALSITANDLSIRDQEPRVLDMRLADALGFSQPRDIRKLIDRNKPELENHGVFCATVAQNTDPKGRGRPGLEYWLNEAQALLVCMFSRTPEAARVRRELVEVFMAWRQQRALPGSTLPAFDFPTGDEAVALIMARVAIVREARMTHGPRAAARLWPTLGLPPVHESQIVEADEGRRCLAELLAASMVEDDPTSPFPIGKLISGALDGDEKLTAEMGMRGLRLAGEGTGRGIVVANFTPFLASVYRDTAWRKGGWRNALRRLPGAQPAGAQRYGHSTQRGTFVPEALVDELSPPLI